MPLLQIYSDPLCAVWSLSESIEDLLLLSGKGDRETFESIIATFHNTRRKKEWLAVRVLLKELLEEDVEISYHADGAPYLKGSPMHISISHTDGYVAVLLQEKPFPGIDIERRDRRILNIRSRFMSDAEEKAIDPTDETLHLLIHWCAKEALYKMLRCENIVFKEHLHIEPFSLKKEGVLHVYETFSEERTRFRLKYEVAPDFVLVWNDH